ncbi:hypothetical protein HD806DRAFT_495830 [Xylariaceae sp. AK1471]|nr:hypothetical protein HD806DRAFT_495830 [Xylariaceae sp. AK1471]
MNILEVFAVSVAASSTQFETESSTDSNPEPESPRAKVGYSCPLCSLIRRVNEDLRAARGAAWWTSHPKLNFEEHMAPAYVKPIRQLTDFWAQRNQDPEDRVFDPMLAVDVKVLVYKMQHLSQFRTRPPVRRTSAKTTPSRDDHVEDEDGVQGNEKHGHLPQYMVKTLHAVGEKIRTFARF